MIGLALKMRRKISFYYRKYTNRKSFAGKKDRNTTGSAATILPEAIYGRTSTDVL